MADEWFEIVSGSALEQGDILLECPVYSLASDAVIEEGAEVTTYIEPIDAIILSQSCDLVEGREKIAQVVLCAAPTLTEIWATAGHALFKKENQSNLVNFRLNNLHPLERCTLSDLPREFSVVHFSNLYTLPIPFLRAHAAKYDKRLRLRSPYRELLSQRFSYFFNRIALCETPKFPASTKV